MLEHIQFYIVNYYAQNFLLLLLKPKLELRTVLICYIKINAV